MEEAQEKCRNVPRRIGGLESKGQPRKGQPRVPRRIGGLEIYGADLRWADLVPRRIGGLETYEDL